MYLQEILLFQLTLIKSNREHEVSFVRYYLSKVLFHSRSSLSKSRCWNDENKFIKLVTNFKIQFDDCHRLDFSSLYTQK